MKVLSFELCLEHPQLTSLVTTVRLLSSPFNTQSKLNFKRFNEVINRCREFAQIIKHISTKRKAY